MSRPRCAALVALLVVCTNASAHGSSKSLGNFFGGVVHPLLEPAHLLALLSLALCLGQRRADMAGPAVACFAAGLLPGIVSTGLGWRPDTDVLLLAIAAIAGLLVAGAIEVPKPALFAACAVAGAGVGLGSGPDVSGAALVATLLGSCLGAIVWLFNGAALVQQARRPWLAILVRVGGSWVTASCVLVLALWFAQAHRPAASPSVPTGGFEAHLDTRR